MDTFQFLNRWIMDGNLNYYSKGFDIIIDIIAGDTHKFSAYTITVIKNGECVESVDVYPTIVGYKDSDELRDTLLLSKQELHAKYIGAA